MRLCFFVSFFCIGIGGLSPARAQQHLYWDMQQLQPTGLVSTHQSSALMQGNNNGVTSFLTSFSASQTYASASGFNNAGLAARTGTLSITSAGSGYFGLMLTPTSGYRLRIFSVSFGSRSTASGPTRWGLFSSVDQFAAPIYSGILIANSSWDFQQSTPLAITTLQPMELRIYGYEGTGSSALNVANWRIDDLSIQYQIDAITLPVSWLFIRQEVSNASVLITWAVSSVVNHQSFEVERSSDGNNYDRIGIIDSAIVGHSDPSGLYFMFRDHSPIPGRSFYRIKQNDQGETYSYSHVVVTNFQQVHWASSIRQLYFDRSTGSIRIGLHSATSSRKFTLYNSWGQQVRSKWLTPQESQMINGSFLSVEVKDLPAGVYYVVADTDKGRTKGKAIMIY